MAEKNAESRKLPVKLLAVDLDDTLLTDELSISGRNREALLEAERRGVIVLLATGRVPESMLRFAGELGMLEREGYLISGNGTLLTRSDTHEVLFRKTLPVEDALYAYRYLENRGIPVMVYHRDTISASRENRWIDEDTRLSGLKKVIVDDYESFLRNNPQLKILIPGEPDEIIKLEMVLKREFGRRFHIIISKPFFLELLPRDADKGTALEYIAEKFSIPVDQVMAVGDSMNDLGMIEYAGTGVAVANALPRLKAAADFILENTNNQDAVAEAVERFILK